MSIKYTKLDRLLLNKGLALGSTHARSYIVERPYKLAKHTQAIQRFSIGVTMSHKSLYI